MKTYTITVADFAAHTPDAPERTAFAMLNQQWDYTFKVWPSEASMRKTIEMQGQSEPRPDHWRSWADWKRRKSA